jgi:hypothetical protein
MTVEHEDISSLIQRLRQGNIWKPAAAARNLQKRKLRGHLPPDATLTDYEVVIQHVLEAEGVLVYIYSTGESPYLAVDAWLNSRLWLVIVSFEGIMETAFVVENSETYLDREAFPYVGKMSEVVR